MYSVIILLTLFTMSCGTTPTPQSEPQLDPNLWMNPDVTFEGEHTMHAHPETIIDSGILKITDDMHGVSIRFLHIQITNWDFSTGSMPNMHILSEKQTDYTFYVDAVIDYSTASNLLPYDSKEAIIGKHKTRIYLFNTGERLYMAWTIYAPNGKILFDEAFHSEIKPKRSCSFIDQRLYCK